MGGKRCAWNPASDYPCIWFYTMLYDFLYMIFYDFIWLVGGAMCPSWKIWVVNGKDDIPNHQPDEVVWKWVVYPQIAIIQIGIMMIFCNELRSTLISNKPISISYPVWKS
jgi:hypothetical protein